ncbi:hypothetical protein BJF79_03885 [Actinomadura sp. CNU-125]|nr:hypothetical protein BJF79_03885 [Actinomadura sp. CNU-125]
MTAPNPKNGTCGRCKQPRPVFPAKKEWGRVPAEMCLRCWQLFAEARANSTFVDWGDAFDNATDEQLDEHIYEAGTS